MEVDGADAWNNPSDGGKFGNLKAFVTAAREFEATHSDAAVNMMTRYLGLIASSCDLSIFSPGRSEVCAFFSSLWRVMCNGRAPHWAGLAVLSRAAIEPSARHALTHTYKFMPILARLLSDSISDDKKIKILSVMQDISYGIKISWQESYLTNLMKQLTTWIAQPMTEAQHRTIGHKSLTVLVNVCYGNLPAIYALMRTVDTKEFVVHLINLKDGGYGGVEVCRLLLCLSGASRGAAAREDNVHSYLCCTMRTFKKAVVERDATQLLHAYTFLNDLSTDNSMRGFVLTYQQFPSAIQDSITDINELCTAVADDRGEPETVADCLRNALKFLTVLVNLELCSLRAWHAALARASLRARACLPEALDLFAALVRNYRDEDRLPQELISIISDGLPGLLVPPSLEPGKAGLQWLQVVSVLCESGECLERVQLEVAPDALEDTLHAALALHSQTGELGAQASQQAVCAGLRAALALSARAPAWRDCLLGLLAHRQIRKLLCAGLTSGDGASRRRVLQLVKHTSFPVDQMNEVFGESLSVVSEASPPALDSAPWAAGGALSPARELALDQLIARLGQAMADNKISDIATSSVMELYGYKLSCLEQRLRAHHAALQGATDQMASLHHTLAMLQATNSSQQDVLYTTQMQNEKNKKTIDEMQKQLQDAESSLRGFRAKLAAERAERSEQREALAREFRQQLANIENEVKAREKDMEEQLKKAEGEHRAALKKIEEQSAKSGELARVLAKFEERVKQRDQRLEAAAAAEGALKKELEHKDATIKQLEKTVVERENRLYQVTAQLEEMKRVQEMVAKLMSKSSSNNTTHS